MKNNSHAEIYNALFKPKSIVVIGGSENQSKPGGKVLANIVEHHYNGSLQVVNPGGARVMGLPTCSSVVDLPDTPQLAIIAIPAPRVAEALGQLGRKGTKATVILSAGFGEKDEQGKQEERRLASIADSFGMTIIGPNCSGFMTPHYSGKFAGIIPQLKPHSIDFMSGSGATVDLVMEQAVLRGLSFCNVVNVGNSVQTGVEDLIGLYDKNYGTEGSPILMLYLEALKKPDLLLKHARSLTKKGCAIVAIKSGISESGARAAASHTGAMATDDKAVQALFDKAGIIRVQSKMELVDVACVLLATGARLNGNRACVITDAGGPGVMLTDELERQGLNLPVLKAQTQKRLRKILPPESAVANPVDCLPSRTPSQVREIFRTITEEEAENIDVIAIQVGNPGMSDNTEIYKEVGHAMQTSPIPVVPTLSSVSTCTSLIKGFTDQGNFYFTDEVNLGRALGKLLGRPRVFETSEDVQDYDRAGIEMIVKGYSGPLPAHAVKNVLEKAGFQFPPQEEAASFKELKKICHAIGYPLALKILGPLHKSDLGGVRLNITTAEKAEQAWKELMRIKGAQGVMVQKMVEGTEVILGASRAEKIGHLVMFGLGGIYTEILKDVRFGLAPLAVQECRDMLTGVRAYPILQGIRGQEGISVDILAGYLERLSRLVYDFPAISEIDINPLKGAGSNLYVIDARIIMDRYTP